ncbi:MAG: hypothetical protein JO219_06945 [Candidatus Eremiobacteraeota bacterium]|nr:hypothetical protein [Candidatus Eremiobacteraeota bacterium]
MLIDVIAVVAMKVTIVKVIRMVVVPKARVPASLYMVVVVIGMRSVFHGTRLSKPTRWVNSTRICQPVAFERFYEDRLAVCGHLQEHWLRLLCSDAPNRPHSKG